LKANIRDFLLVINT